MIRNDDTILRRNTRQKGLVLETVREHCDHPTADAIYLDVRKKDGTVSKGTVYRNLKELSRIGEVNHISVPGADRYDLRTDPHPHIYCTICGAVEDVPIDYASSLNDKVARSTGYCVTQHQTVFVGICPLCQNKGLK